MESGFTNHLFFNHPPQVFWRCGLLLPVTEKRAFGAELCRILDSLRIIRCHNLYLRISTPMEGNPSNRKKRNSA